MFIKYLEIKNFKNIKHVVIEPTSQVNLLSGENGSGKSSVLQAIGYLLTDDLDDKISSFVRWGQKKFEISCLFEHKGIEYSLNIEGDKGAKKTLIFNNEEYYNSDATNKLKEIIDFELTKFSAISEQGKTTQLLFQKKTERLNTLKRLLKVETISESVEEIKEDIRKVKEEIKLIEVELNTLRNISYSYMEEFILPDIEKVKSDLIVIESEKRQYEENEKQKDIELEKLKNKISEIKLSYEKEKSNELSSLKEQIVKLNSVKENGVKDVEHNNAVGSRIFAYQEDIGVLTAKLKDSNNKEQEIVEPSQTKEFLVEYEKKSNEYKFQIQSISKEISNIQNMKCPYNFDCDKLKDVSVDKYIKDKEELETLYINSSGAIDRIKKEFLIYDNAVKFNENLVYEISKLKDKIENANKNITDLRSSLKDDSAYQLIWKDIDNQITDIKYKIVTIEDDYNVKINSEVSVINEEIKKLSLRNTFAKQADYDNLKNQIVIYDTKKQELEKIVKFNEELKQKERQNSGVIRTKEKEIDDKRKSIVLLDEVKDILDKDFSSYLINKGAEHIKNKMNSIFQKSYGRYEITFEQDKSGIDFFYRENSDSELTNVIMASGQEKSVLAIANRLALCSLQNLGILVLDEIDNMASADNSLRLFHTILNEKGYNQIWIISHQEETKEYLENLPNSSVYTIEDGTINN